MNLALIAKLMYANTTYCILHGQRFNSSITTILFEVGSYRTLE